MHRLQSPPRMSPDRQLLIHLNSSLRNLHGVHSRMRETTKVPTERCPCVTVVSNTVLNRPVRDRDPSD